MSQSSYQNNKNVHRRYQHHQEQQRLLVHSLKSALLPTAQTKCSSSSPQGRRKGYDESALRPTSNRLKSVHVGFRNPGVRIFENLG